MVVCGVAIYALLWLLTYCVGAGAVRRAVLESMQLPGPIDEFRAVSEHGGTWPPNTKRYYCRADACGPFLVYVDVGWGVGLLTGERGSALYLWFFGRTVRVHEFSHWSD